MLNSERIYMLKRNPMNSTLKEVNQYLDQGNVTSAETSILEILKDAVNVYHERMIAKSKENLFFAHYTSVQVMHSILKKRIEGNYLRLYGAFSTNDPSEGLYLRDELANEYKWLKDAELSTDAFICSFVSDGKGIGNRITYWQSYGRDGLGCSIQLPQNCSIKDSLYPILYGKEEADKVKYEFKDYLELGSKIHDFYTDKSEKENFATAFWKVFDKIKFSHKHEGYEYEKEYRMIKIPDTDGEIKDDFRSENPYYRRYILDEELQANRLLTSGAEVFIGPRVTNGERLCEYFEKLAKEAKLDGVFTPSQIPYRKIG